MVKNIQMLYIVTAGILLLFISLAISENKVAQEYTGVPLVLSYNKLNKAML